MFASLLLAAAAVSVPSAALPEPAPAQTSHRPRPTGGTQPLTTTTRPNIGFLSAASLQDRCNSSAPGLVSYCFAYITGVHDTVQAYETWLRIREFCPPITSSQSDMRRAFLAYLKDHPDSGSGEAASVIVLALKDQFPCVEAKAAVPAKAPVKR